VTRPENDTALAALAGSRATSLTCRSVLSGARISLLENGPEPLQRPRPDTEGGTHPVQIQGNSTRVPEAPVDGLIRTRYTLAVCVVCGHERITHHGTRPAAPNAAPAPAARSPYSAT